MAEANKVVFEIVLDDGSVKQGFATIEKEGEKVGKSASSSLAGAFKNITSPTDILAGLALIKIAIGKIGDAFSAAFNFAKEGDKLNKLEKNFLNLAAAAGISGDDFKQSIETSAGGLADVSDLLVVANRAMITLGENASRLPEIIDLAKKRTATLGGTLEENVNTLLRAIESGNKRAFREFGLVTIDANRAQQEYAATLGITTQQLTDAERQQSNLNAAIAAGADAFVGAESFDSIGKSVTKLTVAWDDLVELIQQSLASVLTPAFTAISKSLTFILRDLREWLTTKISTDQVAAARAEYERLSREVENLNRVISQPRNINNMDDIAFAQQRIKKATEELTQAQITYNAISGDNRDSREIVRSLDERADKIIDLVKRQDQARAESLTRQGQINQQLLALESQKLNAELSILDKRQKSLETNAEQIKNLNAQILSERSRELQEEKVLELQQAADKASGKIQTEQFYESQRQLIREKSAITIAAIEQRIIDKEKERTDLLLSQNMSVSSSFSLMSEGIKASAEDMAASSAKAFRDLGAQALKSIGSAVGSAFAQFGKSLANGGNALEDFGKSLLSSFGGILVQLGTGYILDGIAKNFQVPGSGGPQIAAGAALATFGGALQAIGGSSGGAVGAGGGVATGGGGIATEPSEVTIAPENEQLRNPTTELQVNINGDILGDEASGERIVDLINTAFDQKGIVIRGGALSA